MAPAFISPLPLPPHSPSTFLSSYTSAKSQPCHLITPRTHHCPLHHSSKTTTTTTTAIIPATATSTDPQNENDNNNNQINSPPRDLDSRGFLIPKVGDLVLFEGKWPSEDAVGLITTLTFTPSRNAHIVDITALNRISTSRFTLPSSRTRKTLWLDIAQIRIITDYRYIAKSDTYEVDNVRDGYSKPGDTLDKEQQLMIAREYEELQTELTKQTVFFAGTVSAVLFVVSKADWHITLDYVVGSVSSVMYLLLLQKSVDRIGKHEQFQFTFIRFFIPVLAFLVVAYIQSGFDPATFQLNHVIGSLSGKDALVLVLGLLTYKVPFFLRTFSEFANTLSYIQQEQEQKQEDSRRNNLLKNPSMISTILSIFFKSTKAKLKSQTELQTDDNQNQTNSKTTQLNRKPVFIFAGPSGVGKSSLIQLVLQDTTLNSNSNPTVDSSKFSYSTSHTTRQRRDHEVDTVDYNFVSDEQFDAMVANNEFIEHANIHGNKYGTSFESINNVPNIGVLDLDIQGVESVHAQLKKEALDWNTRFIWIAPKSLKDLEDRLTARNTEDRSTVKLRLNNAFNEMQFAVKHNQMFDFTVVNDDLDGAYAQLKQFIVMTLNEWNIH